MECRGCATENLTRRGRAAAPYARLVGLILLGVLGGCSTLSPQIFSDRLLVTGKNAAAGTGTAVAVKDANADVEKAKAEIETVQRRYLHCGQQPVENTSARQCRADWNLPRSRSSKRSPAAAPTISPAPASPGRRRGRTALP